MFINCRHCLALIATDPATDLPPARCPRCGGTLRRADAAPAPASAADSAAGGSADADDASVTAEPVVTAPAPPAAVPAHEPDPSPAAAPDLGAAPDAGSDADALPPAAAGVDATAVDTRDAGHPDAPATPPDPAPAPGDPQAGAPAAPPSAATDAPDAAGPESGPSPEAAAPPQEHPPAAGSATEHPPAAVPVQATAADPPPAAAAATGSPGDDAADAATGPADPAFAGGPATATAAAGRRWRRMGIPAAIVLLALLLALQIVLADRERLAADANWRPLVEATCGLLGCAVPPWREPAAIVLVSREVRPHPDLDSALQVRASFRNDARWPQAWPRLLLTLSDVDGRAVAARAFEPHEYLATAPAPTLAPGQAVDIALEIHEPSAATVSYAFDFRE